MDIGFKTVAFYGLSKSRALEIADTYNTNIITNIAFNGIFFYLITEIQNLVTERKKHNLGYYMNWKRFFDSVAFHGVVFQIMEFLTIDKNLELILTMIPEEFRGAFVLGLIAYINETVEVTISHTKFQFLVKLASTYL
jgi:hypothetical protein